MNTKFTAFVIILSLTFSGIFSSCTNEELEGNAYSADIHGKWKLIAGYYFYEGSAMHLNTKKGTLVLVSVDKSLDF